MIMNLVRGTLAIDVGASKIAGALIGESHEILYEDTNTSLKEIFQLR